MTEVIQHLFLSFWFLYKFDIQFEELRAILRCCLCFGGVDAPQIMRAHRGVATPHTSIKWGVDFCLKDYRNWFRQHKVKCSIYPCSFPHLFHNSWVLQHLLPDTIMSLIHLYKHLGYYLYRSCIALFYRKRLPQQNGDRRIGERGTCMRLIVCGSKVGARALPPHAIRGGPCVL
jgi:hypothetical protein